FAHVLTVLLRLLILTLSLHDALPICFPADWRAALCVCATCATAGARGTDRSHSPGLSGARNARGTRGVAAGVDHCGGYVQCKRIAEFAGGVQRDGFFAAAREVHGSGQVLAALPTRDIGVGI